MEEGALNKAAENGLSSPEFFELCVWLGSQIKSLCNMEESITAADGVCFNLLKQFSICSVGLGPYCSADNEFTMLKFSR